MLSVCLTKESVIMKSKLDKKERDNYRGFHIPGGANYQHPQINSVPICSSNLIRHELSKCVGAIQAHKYGDIKFTERLISLIREIEIEIEAMKLTPQKSAFISEAMINNSKPARRVDLCILRSDQIVEFETDKSIIKPGALSIYI